MRTPILALLMLLAGACSSNKPRELSTEEQLGIYLENALRYYELRDLERTENQCLRGLKLDPDNERFLLILGKVYLIRGQTEDILRALAIFEKHPNQDDWRIHLGKAEAHERLSILESDAADAIASGARYTDKDPEERAAELRKSSAEHLDQAIQDYLAAEQIHDGEINAVNGLIRTYALSGNYEESLRWGNTLIEVLQASSKLRRVELEDVGITASRERELTAAVRRNSDMIIKVRFHRATLLHEMGRDQEAVDELGLILSLDPEVSQAYSQRAQLLLALGQPLQARESIEKFIKLEAARPFDDPEIRRAYELLGRCEEALSGDSQANSAGR